MKTLFLKQKVFKFTDHYTIFDEHQTVHYYVDQDFKLIGNTVHVKDKNELPLFTINKEIFTFLPRFVVDFVDGRTIILQSRFKLFNSRIDIEYEGGLIRVDGDIFEYNFKVYFNDNEIGNIRRKFFSWGDAFTLNVLDESYQDIFVAVVIAVDYILDAQQKN